MKDETSTYLMAGLVLVLITSSILAPRLEAFATLIFAGLMLLTVFIYTIYTKNMVEEETKTRRLEFKERQLKYFYSPISKIIRIVKRELRNNEPEDNYDSATTILSHITIESFEEIDNYQFYANKKIQNSLNELHNYSRIYFDDDGSQYIYENTYEIRNTWISLIKEIDEEKRTINNEINELING